ncbi:hypothetical protein B0H16DRAFT_1569669 [Mycena metata]|uniref:Zn(2)-C6 fungal-type domain-containing protein n=1 Tax=Mycena metata TaxID=1033252 RepID=A0AAD7MYN5_9AGAR|nr:hypothetical protein B0H16DRAFT_1569669 [Mycena metata]
MHQPTRRAKSTAACTSCRRHKTRCEILDHSSNPVRCHRCKVLSMACSHEHTQVPTPTQDSVSPEHRGRPRRSSPTIRATIRAPASGSESRRGFQSGTATPVRLWSFVPEAQDLDWSAPMLGIQHLTSIPTDNAAAQEFVNNDLSLSTILPDGRIDYLLDLFNIHYTPWLNFRPLRNSKNPFVDIACSAVAARHLEGEGGKAVRLRLQALAHDSIARMIFSPGAPDSIEAVQCLLIMSLWRPFGLTLEIHGWTSRSLLSAAVRIAMNLRLNHASAVVKDSRKYEFPDATSISEAYEQALLWIALTNAESMLCLGTRSEPLSRRSDDDCLLIQFPVVLDARTDLRNLRLGLTARQFDLYEECSMICLGSELDKVEWARDIKSVLQQMRRGSRHLMPMAAVLEREQFYFQALHISDGIARLLVLYHAFWEARSTLPQIPRGEPWHGHFISGGAGEALFFMWARDMLQTSEALLVAFLSAPPNQFCTAPDNYFHMVALAAGYLIGVKFLLVREGPRSLLGAADLILAKTVTNLRRAAYGPGHAAHRCALLVEFMLAKWNERERPETCLSQGIFPAVDLFQVQIDGSPPSPLVDVEFMFLNTLLADDKSFWDALAQDELKW